MVKRTETVDGVIGGNIKAIRVDAGLSQEQLADKITEVSGVSMHQQTILKIESGQRPLRYTEAAAIAKALSVPLATFTDGTTGAVEESAVRRRLESAARHTMTGVGAMLKGYREYLETVIGLQDALKAALEAGVVTEAEAAAVRVFTDVEHPVGDIHDAVIAASHAMNAALGLSG